MCYATGKRKGFNPLTRIFPQGPCQPGDRVAGPPAEAACTLASLVPLAEPARVAFMLRVRASRRGDPALRRDGAPGETVSWQK